MTSASIDDTDNEFSEIEPNAAEHIQRSERAEAQFAGQRFDQVAAQLFPEYSRSTLQSWIKQGNLRIEGKLAKPNVKLGGGELLQLDVTLQREGEWEAENIPLDILHQDGAVIVINKPAGLVVHPAAGNWQGTLLNALLFHFPELRQIPRAGIVHRLDKDTSGLMVVARSLEAQNAMVKQLQARSVSRIYQALVHGECDEGDVDAPIGRHPSARTKMAVVANGKPARTHYKSLERFQGFSSIELKLESGRTHQIRVHMAHIGFPLLGDPVYGKRISEQEKKRQTQLEPIASFPRQALHAKKLGFIHPQNNDYMEWSSELPEDFTELLEHLRHAF